MSDLFALIVQHHSRPQLSGFKRQPIASAVESEFCDVSVPGRDQRPHDSRCARTFRGLEESCQLRLDPLFFIDHASLIEFGVVSAHYCAQIVVTQTELRPLKRVNSVPCHRRAYVEARRVLQREAFRQRIERQQPARVEQASRSLGRMN